MGGPRQAHGCYQMSSLQLQRYYTSLLRWVPCEYGSSILVDGKFQSQSKPWSMMPATQAHIAGASGKLHEKTLARDGKHLIHGNGIQLQASMCQGVCCACRGSDAPLQ